VVVLARLCVADAAYRLRRATPTDVPAIVRLLAADQLRAARDGVPAGGITDRGVADRGGTAGDGADLTPYRRAFAAIDADPAHLLVVLTPDAGETDAVGPAADGSPAGVSDAAISPAVGSEAVVGTMQLSFIPGLARRGALRAQVEAVRVREDHRGAGLGGAMMSWAIAEARRRGCALVQLTSDKRRAQAHRFYGRLGFVASHEGFKLTL
jgi:GNAT superfamily N-acetyltransferase